MTNRTIIFDLDGTLIDSAPDVCGALNRTLVPFGRKRHDVEDVKGYLGQGARVLMERALHKTGDVPDASMIDQLTQQFLADYANNPVIDTYVFPGVIDVLETLKAEGAQLAICTNKPGITTAPVLDALNLGSYFEAVICGDQVKNRKPSGDHILDTIRAIDGCPDNAVMIGDSENDIDAAIDAGIRSIVVTFGYTQIPHDELGAHAQISSFTELLETMDQVLAR